MFKQSKWLKPYITFNCKMRKQYKNIFEKEFYEFLINALFGKTMEQIRNRMNLELVSNQKRLEKLIKNLLS